ANVSVAILFLVAISAATPLITFMAGWSSNNKYSLLGAMRVIAMAISYEIPLVLALLGVVLFTGHMDLQGIVRWQQDRHTWLFILTRGTLPRLRIDQLLAFAWKFLLPLALANVLLVALEVMIWQEGGFAPEVVLPIFAVVNWVLSAALVVGYTRSLGFVSVQR